MFWKMAGMPGGRFGLAGVVFLFWCLKAAAGEWSLTDLNVFFLSFLEVVPRLSKGGEIGLESGGHVRMQHVERRAFPELDGLDLRGDLLLASHIGGRELGRVPLDKGQYPGPVVGECQIKRAAQLRLRILRS